MSLRDGPRGDVHRILEDVIVSQIAAIGADMLVMGGYGHSPQRTMIVGSTTTEMIRYCTVSVLLFR